MEGKRGLKKLFRSSKSGLVEPLVLPPEVGTTATPNTPTTANHSSSTTTAKLPANSTGTYSSATTPSTTPAPGPTTSAPIHDMHKRRQQQPAQQPQPPSQQQQPQSQLQKQPAGGNSFPMDANRNDAVGVNAAVRRPVDPAANWGNPSLAEMAKVEAARLPQSHRGPPGTTPPLNTSPWPQAHVGAANSSPVNHQPALYLPPGARPPSPQIRPPRPVTPTRAMAPAGGMQPPQATFADGDNYPTSRSRGYSSASRLSEQDVIVPTGGKLVKPAAPAPNRFPLGAAYAEPPRATPTPPTPQYSSNWQTSSVGSDRSVQRDDMERLDKSAMSDRMDKGDKDKEKKRFWNWGHPKHKDHKDGKDPKDHKERHTPKDAARDGQRGQQQPQPQQQRQPGQPQPPLDVQREQTQAQAYAQRPREDQQQQPPQRPRRPPYQQMRDGEQLSSSQAQLVANPPVAIPQHLAAAVNKPRASMDNSRQSHEEHTEVSNTSTFNTNTTTTPNNGTAANSHHGSSAGHGEEARVVSRKEDEPAPAEGNDVGSAIRKLAGSRETTHGSVLDLCDRVNASTLGEAIGKEAARSLRKILKTGTDAERRMALRIWWITMRNIKVNKYNQYATSRKFLSSIEPIITQQIRPPPSASTLKACRDILSDLTFCNYSVEGCEALYELWQRVRQPGDPEFGKPLPEDYLKQSSAKTRNTTPGSTPPVPSPQPLVTPTPRAVADVPTPPVPAAAAPLPGAAAPARPARPGSPGGYGPSYASLPDHKDDMRRLVEECTAAKAAARVLIEALVYTRPEELEHKGVIREFYTKCVLAHESLTAQMQWASAEADKSRRCAEPVIEKDGMTREENALTLVIEAHSLVADGLKQYDDLERMAIDEREMRAVQERSKKDTRMDRKQQYDLLMVGENEGQASSSRSPSPAHTSVPLPDESGRSSPMHSTRPGSAANQHLASLTDDRGMSRTPSPDGRRRLVHPQPIIAGGAVGGAPPPVPPKKMSSPTRTDSPLGRRIPGPRPLPNPFRSGNSHQNLTNHAAVQAAQEPMNGADSSTDEEEEIEVRPSRKALGKRRAEPDNDFDPDDMFKTDKVDAMSIHSITADDIYLDKRTVYAYDAWAENEVARKEKALAPSSPMSVSPTNPSAKDVSAAHANGTTGYTAAADAVAAR